MEKKVQVTTVKPFEPSKLNSPSLPLREMGKLKKRRTWHSRTKIQASDNPTKKYTQTSNFSKSVLMCHLCSISRLWMDGSFEDLNAEEVERTTDDFYKEILKTSKVYKAKIKQQTQENNPRRFKGNNNTKATLTK